MTVYLGWYILQFRTKRAGPDPREEIGPALRTNPERLARAPIVGAGRAESQSLTVDTGRRFITRPPTRVELSARITALEGALDCLLAQAEVDRRGAFRCTGAVKNELLTLEAQRRDMDRQADGFAAALTSPDACDRLQRAGAELASVRSDLAADRIRSEVRFGNPARAEWLRQMSAREMQRQGSAFLPDEEVIA